MASHVECNRVFAPYEEPVWFGNEGVIHISFESGVVVEPRGGILGADVTLPCKNYHRTVPCKQTALENLLWRAKRQWHRWFPE